MFRKPLSTLAAFTDRDLGMRMGFSRITAEKGGREEGQQQRGVRGETKAGQRERRAG